jgi:hypothetical protein
MLHIVKSADEYEQTVICGFEVLGAFAAVGAFGAFGVMCGEEEGWDAKVC